MNLLNNQNLNLGPFQKNIEKRLKKMKEQNFAERLWNKDESLWNKERLKDNISTISVVLGIEITYA
jgi:hypothetical protein